MVRRPRGSTRLLVSAAVLAAAPRGRLHGRPAEVMPRHVDFGSLESERVRRDSGVLATNGIVTCD